MKSNEINRKKLISIVVVIALMVLGVGVSQVAFASSSNDLVYLSSESGSDSGNGTEASPFKTLDKALATVADGGTIRVVGTYSASSWNAHGKTVTITGGEMDFTGVPGKITLGGLGDTLAFNEITLDFIDDTEVFANGCKLTIGENVTLTHPICLFGGTISGILDGDTSLKVYSGDYYRIYGGGNNGTTMTGSTDVLVGGTVNSNLDVSDHEGNRYIYGGGRADTINGSTKLTFTGNAKSTHLFGGSNGSGSSIGEGSNIIFAGGQSMSLYGGSNGVDTGSGANVLMTGGTIEQVFGGCQNATLTGNVDVKVLGGTVTRRIYGGCYNECEYYLIWTDWKSSYSVDGNITLTIGGEANITLNASSFDRGIWACSRLNPKSSTEKTTLVFADQTAYNNYRDDVGAEDILGKAIMNGINAADNTHFYQYNVNNDTKVITETCAYCSDHLAAATLSIDENASLIYTGSAIDGAKIEYSSDWEGELLDISYTDNTDAGQAAASCIKNGETVTINFTIEKAEQSVPILSKTDETIKGKADGKISGLTSAMEYSLDGSQYTPVTDVNMSLASGTYYVRYAEKDNYKASSPVTMVIAEGKMIEDVYIQDDAVQDDNIQSDETQDDDIQNDNTQNDNTQNDVIGNGHSVATGDAHGFELVIGFVLQVITIMAIIAILAKRMKGSNS